MTNSINSASSSITNSINDVNNTLTDTATDDSQVDFVSESNQDLTSGFFTSLLTKFQTAFSNRSPNSVSFPIPFTNKSINFSSWYVRTMVENNSAFSVIVDLATAFWWFVLSYYIILDIYKKINALKSGDITNIENDNITTDLL